VAKEETKKRGNAVAVGNKLSTPIIKAKNKIINIAAVVASIVGLLAALIGLRWGISRFMRWVSGRKF